MQNNSRYTVPEDESVMAKEPALAFPVTANPIHLDVTIEDISMVTSIQNALKMIKGITSIRIASKAKDFTADPFSELDTTWGGDRDANEIAEELHAMRTDSRTVEAW